MCLYLYYLNLYCLPFYYLLLLLLLLLLFRGAFSYNINKIFYIIYNELESNY